MLNRIAIIEAVVRAFPGVAVVTAFTKTGEVIHGGITVREEGYLLPFAVEIYPQYPFQFHGSETIRFINKELLPYDHVNADGSVCVHTLHHPEIAQKLQLDLNGLCHWMLKCYISREADSHYEHIIVNPQPVNGEKRVFLFSEVDHRFKKGDFGHFGYSMIGKGRWKEQPIVTAIIQWLSIKNRTVRCDWSDNYRQLAIKEGLFYFNDSPPVENGRFAAGNFLALEDYFSQEFLRFLDTASKHPSVSADAGGHLPVLLGYPTRGTEIHWQTILIPHSEFPSYGQKIPGTTIWMGKLKDQPVLWAQTSDSSYRSFFGRGGFHPSITKANILILGIGAIGSIVAKTLVRGGVRKITLVDHDIKEPENVCRGEYHFLPGLTAKVNELSTDLVALSPFVDVKTSETLTDFFKVVINGGDSDWAGPIKRHLDEFEIIFDCTTDNDMAYLLDKIGLKSDIYCLSITNHARKLICGVKENLYRWLGQTLPALEDRPDDLYKPTGCWSPTFKASYNDICLLTQAALRHINGCYERAKPPRPFYLGYMDEDSVDIKLQEC